MKNYTHWKDKLTWILFASTLKCAQSQQLTISLNLGVTYSIVGAIVVAN